MQPTEVVYQYLGSEIVRFNDLYVFTEKRFAVGVELDSGKYYLSIPVSNSRVDYEEYFEIDRAMVEACPRNTGELEALANRCRAGLNDERLLVQPGRDRGVGR
jgi:hypothetical protein